MTGRRTYGRRSSAPRAARWMELRYAAPCKVCARRILAGERAFYDYSARTATCTDMECADADGLTTDTWVGAPTSGQFVPTLAAQRLGSGYRPEATWKQRYGRCEDAPCCGCCS